MVSCRREALNEGDSAKLVSDKSGKALAHHAENVVLDYVWPIGSGNVMSPRLRSRLSRVTRASGESS